MASSTTGQGARHSAGSRLPCSARPAPTRRRASSSGDAPVDADHVGSGGAHQRRAARRCRRRRGCVGTPRSAMPSRTARVAGSAKRAYSAGESEPAQLSKSCTAWAPASICARSEATRHGGEPVGQLLPQPGVPVHERLDLGEGARGAALHRVAGHGEGRAGEADQRDPDPASSRRTRPHRLGDVGRVGGRLEGPEAGQVGLAAERLGHHRARGPAPRRRRSRWRAGARRCRRRGWRRPRRSGGPAAGSARPTGRRRRWRRGWSPSPRAARYSGSDRPAWRMNHTGVRVTGSRKQARTRSVRASAAGLTRSAL